jgi:hypothetical protein
VCKHSYNCIHIFAFCIRQVRGRKVSDMSAAKKVHNTPSSIISINGQGKASIVEHLEFSTTSKESAQHGISRLRNKRLIKTFGKSRNRGQLKVRHGMMSMPDKIFQFGESSDAAYMPRCIGILGEAEHFGRLK